MGHYSRGMRHSDRKADQSKALAPEGRIVARDEFGEEVTKDRLQRGSAVE